MGSDQPATGSTALVERFPPTSGRVSGALSGGLMLLGAVAVALFGESLGAAALAVGLMLGAFANYVALVRPTMHAYEDHLRLRNMLTDTEVPWHLVDGVVVRQTTRIYVDDEVHHAIGVGRSARAVIRSDHQAQMDRSPGVLGLERLSGMSEEATEAAGSERARYPDYVETRLADLVKKQTPTSRGRGAVRQRWALPETLLLGVLSAAFAVLAVLAWLV